MKLRNFVLTTFCLAAFTATSFGQVNQRRENQQDRIGNGVQSGRLTAGETANLENRERSLNQEVQDDRLTNGGKLTTRERQQINRQQNQLSNSIYRDNTIRLKTNTVTAKLGGAKRTSRTG